MVPRAVASVGRVRCPYCSGVEDRVVDSRLAEDGQAIRRRRECAQCTRRYTTYERLEEQPLRVLKRSGEDVPFAREKLVAGISHAVTGRPVEDATVEAMALEIEEVLRGEGPEVTSQEIGLAVLERLKALDPVSYLRFASVYKGFEGVEDFEREVTLLQKTTAPKSRPRR
ncbi:MAG: transcriptional regulator NrdR [Acidimicrobiia bacterium]|nr:transcriptional regulator NrdR [Acidimicrobiia bacterium]